MATYLRLPCVSGCDRNKPDSRWQDKKKQKTRLIPKIQHPFGTRRVNSQTCARVCVCVSVCGPEDEDGFDCVLL